MENKNNTAVTENKLQGNMNTGELVMTVLAFSAPLVTVAGTLTVLLGFGGTSTPIIYVCVTVILLIFSVGFTKMGTMTERPGGFYAFISEGLGKPIGLGSAFLATLGYTCIGLFCAPFFGTWVCGAIEMANGPAIPWWVFALAFIALSTFFAYRKIDLSAKIMFYVMLLECLVIIIFDIASFIKGSPTENTSSLITMSGFSGSGFGMALLFAVGNFIGFEATVIYREEVKDPQTTVPKATYIAVIGIGVFYAIAAVAYAVCFGADNIQAEAAADPAGIFLIGLGNVTGKIIVDCAIGLTMFSTFACCLSIHNVSSRYLFSLGTDGVLPKGLGKVHKKHKSPSVAALTIAGIWVVMTIIFAIIGTDPNYLYPVFSGSGTFAVVAIMFLSTIAVAVYLRKHKEEANASVWTTVIAPVLAIIGMGIVVVFAVMFFGDLLGATGATLVIFFIGIIVVGLAGVILACVLKNTKPDVYKKIGRED